MIPEKQQSANRFKAGCLIFPALLLLASSAFFYIYQNKIAVFVGKSLVVEDPFDKADAIVVLGGSIPDRMLEAIALYNEGHSDLIILTKTLDQAGYNYLKELNAEYPLDHEVKLEILRKLEIPRGSIAVLDGKMPNTYFEALNTFRFLDKQELNSVIVVTSKLHTRRTSIIFNDLAGERFKVYVKPSRYDPYDPDNPVSVKNYSRTILYEIQKLLFYKITSFFPAEYPALN